jgi:hypothetical protein
VNRTQRLVLPLMLFLFGCSEGGNSGPVSEGVQWTVDTKPTLMVGGSDNRKPYQLFQVVGATRLTDGRLVVANGGTSELRYYSREGEYLMAVGRAGDGPGELRGIMQVTALPGDTVMVVSFRPGLTWYDPQGKVVRSRRIDFWSVGSTQCRLGEGNWHALEDGSLLTILEDNFSVPGCPPNPSSPWRQTGLVGRANLDSGVFDTLAIMPATERNSPNFRVFGRSLLMTWGGGAVYLSDTGSSEILKLGLTGDTLAVWRTPFEARPVPENARAVSRREFKRPDGTLQVGADYMYPDFYPTAGRLLLARTGELWVMAYPALTEPTDSWRLDRAFAFVVDSEGAEWRVLGENGRAIASVRTPPGLFPLEVSEEFLVGLSKDDMDVQTVSVYRLSR